MKDNLGANLPYLQNLIKKDKVSHKDDVNRFFFVTIHKLTLFSI